MKLKYTDKSKLIATARGDVQADIVLTNAQILNVFTGEIRLGDIYVSDNAIAHVEYDNRDNVNGKEIIDVEKRYVIPGLIDAHMHIESTMLTPRNFTKAALPHGTTTIITDPHEAANVTGVRGVQYMHDSAEGLPMRHFVDIPSCVPSVLGLENSGAEFGVQEIETLASLDRVIGLAEVMDYLGVINGEARMMDIIAASEQRGLFIQGHAPSVSGRDLSAYICGGPRSCHESRSGAEGLEKLRAGLFVDARESSITKNVKDIWEAIKGSRYLDTLCLCTDDKEAEDVLVHGHMNEVVNAAISYGMNPIDAIRCASFNTAREVQIDNLGAIAPGHIADMLVVDTLDAIHPVRVFYEGKQVASEGSLDVEIPVLVDPIELENTVFVDELSLSDFEIIAPIENGTIMMHGIEYHSPHSSLTTVSQFEMEVVDSRIVLPEAFNFVAVVNRHKNNNGIALGIVKNFGMQGGALASTVSHDSHNLTIVYNNAENALCAANALMHQGGGMSAVKDNEVLHTLDLPVFGLMSHLEAEALAIENRKMKDANRSLGMTEFVNPLMRITTLSLIVIPEAKMSDLGLVAVSAKEIKPLFIG